LTEPYASRYVTVPGAPLGPASPEADSLGPSLVVAVCSVGVGVRAAYGDRFRLDVMLAEPLDRTPLQTRRGDTRLLVTLTARLWPWRSR